jgi:hypothetical protein
MLVSKITIEASTLAMATMVFLGEIAIVRWFKYVQIQI